MTLGAAAAGSLPRRMASPRSSGELLVSQSPRRPCAGCLVFFLVILASGCSHKTSAPAPLVVQHAAPTPGEIELSEPKVAFVEPDLVQVEVKYRFTKGQPDKYYSCDITFPGTRNRGVKPMLSWELKPEGVIRDKFQLSKPGAKTFEISMSETESPQSGYTKISNVVSGPIQ